MYYFRITLALLLMKNSLMAEIIGNPEHQLHYQLPKTIQKWKIEMERETKCMKTSTVLYISKNTSLENAKESFYVDYIGLPGKTLDQRNREFFIKFLLSVLEVKIILIETFPQSTLYEWSAIKNNLEIEHGWVREFSTLQESATLMYRTKNLEAVEQLRPILIQVLKKAKLTNGYSN